MASVVNNCLQFDGIDDFVEVEMTLPPSDMTHELWFKTTVPNGSLFCVVNQDRTSSDRRIYLHEGSLYASFWNDDPIGSSGLNLADGQWHHVAYVYGTAINGQQLYLDGRLVAQSATTGATLTRQTHLLIGYCPDSTYAYFEGRIADVRVWNTIASPEQINEYMPIGLWGTEPGLLGYWPFKGGRPDIMPPEAVTEPESSPESPPEPPSEPQPESPPEPEKKRGQKGRITVVDKTRQHNGRLSGALRMVDPDLNLAPPPSLTNPALIFDGTDDYIEVPNPFLNTATFTIELWARPEHLGDGQEYGILGYQEPDGQCKPGLSLVSANGGLRYDAYDAAGTRYTGVLEQFFDQPDRWIHLAWVNDGTQYRFYRNGKPFHTVEIGPSQFVAPAKTPYWVGRFTHVWAGQLAEVRVWETARTPKQLRQQMKHRLRGNEEGLVACWPLNEGTQVVTDVTDTSHNGQVLGARLGNSTLQFRAPKTEPSGAAIASSTYIPQPDSIVDLLVADNIFKALYERFQAAITVGDDTIDLLLDANVLGAFNLFQTLAELKVTSLLIKDVRIEFISEEAEIDWGSKAAEKFMGLRLSGTASLLGLAQANALLECVLDDDDFEPATVLKLRPTSDLHLPVEELLSLGKRPPATIKRLLNYVGKLHIACPVLAVANESVEGETEFPFSLGIDKGLNIYGGLDLAGVSGKNPFALIREWLKVQHLDLHTSLCKHTAGWHIMQEAVVAKDTPVLSGVGVELVYKGATVGLEIAGNPPEVSLLISNTLMLSLNWFDAENLYLTGSMRLEPESFTGAYTLQQSPGGENVWNPFGITGVSVQALAMQLGGTYLAPWIDNVGIATEDVTIGATRASLAVLVDTNDPDQFVFHLSINQTTLLELLSAFTPVSFAAYQALPRRWRNLLEQIVDIDFSDVVIHIVPAPTQIGNLVFDDEGIIVKGKLSPWGWDAEVAMVVDWDDLDLSLAVEPISLKFRGFEFLTVSGRDDDEYARLRFAHGADIETQWYAACEIILLKTQHSLFTEHQADVTTLKLASALPFLRIGLNVDRRDDTTLLAGRLNLTLNLKKPGRIRVLDDEDVFGLVLNLSGEFTGRKTDLSIALNVDFQFRWGAHQTRLALSPRFATTIPDLKPVKQALSTGRFKQFRNPRAALASVRKPRIRLAADLLDHQVVQEDADVRRNGATGRSELVTRLTHDYQQIAQQAAVVIQEAGFSAADVGTGLLMSMSRLVSSKRARQHKTRRWLEAA